MSQPDPVDTYMTPEEIALAEQKEHTHPNVFELEMEERELVSAFSARVDKPIEADCDKRYRCYHKSGKRPLSAINLIVMHDTEGGTARSVGSYGSTAKAGGSWQLVLDDHECYRGLEDNEVPWGAPGVNYNGFHIEQCGYAKWTAAIWSKTHRRTLMRGAYKAAYHCRKYGIKPVFRTAANLKAGVRNGVTTHAECSKAYGGDHHDPGTGWPRVLFMAMLKGYYVKLWRVKKVA